MTNAHKLMDVCLWIWAAISFAEYVRDAMRHKSPALRNRRLPSPSIHCQRTPDWDRINRIALLRRQGE